MNILGILSCSINDSKISRMFDLLMKTLESSGHNVEKVCLHELEIGICKKCMICKTTKECVQKDDVKKLSEKFMDADVVVLAAQKGWGDSSAIVKNLFERMSVYCTDTKDCDIELPLIMSKKYITITSNDTPFPYHFLSNKITGFNKVSDAFFRGAGFKKMIDISLAENHDVDEIPDNIVKRINKVVDAVNNMNYVYQMSDHNTM